MLQRRGRSGLATLLKTESSHLADVNSSQFVSLGVPVAELSHRGDGIETSILSQRRRDDLKGVAVGSHTAGLHTAQGA